VIRRSIKRIAVLAALLLACIPATFVLTLLLLPVWSWIEARYGIEAVGHSGPSDWCFWLVFGVLAASATAFVARLPRR
jgi:hypothetical protein